MRVFVFLLMMAVAVGGILGGYRVITGTNLIGLSDFGIGGARADTGVVPATTQPIVATPVPTAEAPATPVTHATATPAPAKPQIMVIGNTDGQGAFLRKTPHLNDRLRAWVDGTKMQIKGAVESDGIQWMQVVAPDGTEGYIPKQYLVPAPAEPTPNA